MRKKWRRIGRGKKKKETTSDNLGTGIENTAERKTPAKQTIRSDCGRGNICWQNASAKSLTGRRTLFGQPLILSAVSHD
jgi:hypothetical protein